MVKILLFSDLHLRVNDSLGVIKDGVNSRLEDKRNVLQQITDIAIENKVDLVCDLGDTFDSINPSDKLRNLYATELNRITYERDMQFVRILGNHETDGKCGSGVDVAIWSNGMNYNVIDKPFNFSINGMDILFIPEVSNELVIESLEAYPDSVVLGHFGVQGADYGSGKRDETGLLLKHFKNRVQPTYLGHYHKRQSLLVNKINYIGAICKANFGDKDITTGVTLLTFDDNNELADSTYIEIPDKQLIEIKFTEDTEERYKIQFGAVVKLRYYGTSEWFQLKDVKGTISEYYKYGASKVFVDFNMTNSDIKELDEVDTNFQFEDLIIKRANEDNQNKETGLKYLRKVLECKAGN